MYMGFKAHGESWHRVRCRGSCSWDLPRRTGDASTVSAQLDVRTNPCMVCEYEKASLKATCGAAYTVKQSYINASAAGLMVMETSSGIGGA